MKSREILQNGKSILQSSVDGIARFSTIFAITVASRQGNLPINQHTIQKALVNPETYIVLDSSKNQLAPKITKAAELEQAPVDISPTIFTSTEANTLGEKVETYSITLSQWSTLKNQLGRSDTIAQKQANFPNYMADNTKSLLTIISDSVYTQLQIDGTPIEQIILNTEKNVRALQVAAGILPNATGTNSTAGLQMRTVIRITGGGSVSNFAEYDQPDAQTNSLNTFSLPTTTDGQLFTYNGFFIINGIHLPNGQTGYTPNSTKELKVSVLEMKDPDHTTGTASQFDIDSNLTGIPNALKFGIDVSTNPNLTGITTTGANNISVLDAAIEKNKGGETHVAESIYGTTKYVEKERLGRVSFRFRKVDGGILNTTGNPTIASVDYYPAISTGSGGSAKKISAIAKSEHGFTNVLVDNLYPEDPFVKLAIIYVKVTDTNNVSYWGVLHYGADFQKTFLAPPATQANSVPDSISLEIEVVTGSQTLSSSFWNRNPTVLQWRTQSTATPVQTATTTATRTQTLTPTPSATFTISPTPSLTETYTSTSTSTHTATATNTPTPTESVTSTNSPTKTETLTPDTTSSATVTPSETPTPTSTETATSTSTPTQTIIFNPTVESSPTTSSTATVIPIISTPTPTQTPEPKQNYKIILPKITIGKETYSLVLPAIQNDIFNPSPTTNEPSLKHGW